MGIVQGMVPARGAPAVPGSPFLGKPVPYVQGRGHGGTLEHGETHPWDCPTWVLETGCTARGRSEQYFHLQTAPNWGSCPFSVAPSSIPCCEGPGAGLLVPQVAGGELSPCAWHPPFSAILWLCQGWEFTEEMWQRSGDPCAALPADSG